MIPFAFGVVLVIALWIAWLEREEELLTPDSGLGYWLGIAGSGAMLILLLYPVRKRSRFAHSIGSIGLWFRLHMALGLFGPALILLHSNFQLGSLNSNVALIAMLIVAASGVVGRYLYGKIHLGFYGRKAEVQGLLVDAEALKQSLGRDLPGAERILDALSAYAQQAVTSHRGVLASLRSVPVVGMRTRLLRAKLLSQARRIITSEGRRLGWSPRERRRRLSAIVEMVTLYFAAVRKAAEFAFYERVFGLWHVLHLPLFVVLILAAVIHVVAVHFY